MKTECMRLKLALWNEDIFKSRPSFTKWVLKKKEVTFFHSKCPKTTFFCSRNSGNTHHCQSFSRFSPNSFSSLFSLILPVTYGFTDYYTNACPLEMQNGRCQSEISNGWREKKKMKSYFPCWWCLFCKSQTTVFHLCVHFSSQEDKKMEEQNNGVSSYFSQAYVWK